MSKRPFNKIRKIQKKENIEIPDEPKEEQKEEQNIPRDIQISKPLIFQPQKKRINIVNNDALKNNQDNTVEPQPKPSLGSKPTLFRGKKQGNKIVVNSNRASNNNEPAEESYNQAPKPTPLVIKKRANFDFKNRERENIIIQEQQQSQRFDAEESKQINVEQNTSFARRPDLKIKRLNPKRQFPERGDIQEQSGEFNRSNQQPNYSNQIYTPALLEYREINIQPATAISEGRVDKQKKRTNQLKNLLNLEIDLYEQTLSIGNVTSYEIYINKIKAGYLKNSQDQAFDEKSSDYCQTLSFQYSDFTNQCPQDYSMDIDRIQNLDANHAFDQFVLRIAPLIQQLIKPTNSITQPPIFLLAFRPAFKSFLKCPYPIFIYHSEEFNLDLLVVGEKLYITEGQIESVLMIGKTIIGGLKSGHLILWNGENSKASRLYRQIKQFTNTTNFELPAYCTHHLQKFSPYASDTSIVSLLHDERSDFLSLDASGKIVKWSIQDGAGGSQSLKATSVTELRNMVQRPALKAYSIKKRSDSLYVNTSMGIICMQNNEIKQKLDNDGSKIVDFQIPKRSPLVYTISENNSLQIYNQLYSYRLFRMDLAITNEQLTQIIIPQLQHDNREIVLLSAIYLTDSAGSVYQVKILQNQYQFTKKLGQQQDTRKQKNVIFRGVNRMGESLETLRLMRDLKLKTQSIKMGINTQKSVSNLKSIIEKNRQLMTLLEQQNPMII